MWWACSGSAYSPFACFGKLPSGLTCRSRVEGIVSRNFSHNLSLFSFQSLFERLHYLETKQRCDILVFSTRGSLFCFHHPHLLFIWTMTRFWRYVSCRDRIPILNAVLHRIHRTMPQIHCPFMPSRPFRAFIANHSRMPTLGMCCLCIQNQEIYIMRQRFIGRPLRSTKHHVYHRVNKSIMYTIATGATVNAPNRSSPVSQTSYQIAQAQQGFRSSANRPLHRHSSRRQFLPQHHFHLQSNGHLRHWSVHPQLRAFLHTRLFIPITNLVVTYCRDDTRTSSARPLGGLSTPVLAVRKLPQKDEVCGTLQTGHIFPTTFGNLNGSRQKSRMKFTRALEPHCEALCSVQSPCG